MLSARVIERLSTYRRVLRSAASTGKAAVYSHELAALSACTPAQVRRDIMTVGYTGTPAKGYDVSALVDEISGVLDAPGNRAFALLGVGHIGQAVMAYFPGRSPHLTIAAAFDSDPQKAGRVIHGCRCYAMDELERVLGEQGIDMALIAVPAAAAQPLADRLIEAGVKGLLNFAPVRLQVPPGVYVEHVDITVSLEKVAFFARSAKQ